MGQERPLLPLEGRAAESFHHPPTVLDRGWGGTHHCKAQRTDRRARVEPQTTPVSVTTEIQAAGQMPLCGTGL